MGSLMGNGFRKTLILCSALLAGVCASAQDGAVGLAGPPEPMEMAVPGPLAAPLPSPDGRFLAFTGPSFEGLWLLNLETGAAFRLTDQRGAGFRPAWSPDGRSLAYRATVGSSNPHQIIAVAHPDGVVEVASPLLDGVSLPFWRDLELGFVLPGPDEPRLRTVGPPEPARATRAVPAATPEGRLFFLNRGAAVKALDAPPDKVFFLPSPSPDGRLFICECLDGHLYLGSTEGGALRDLGPGSYPSFVRDGTALLFERTRDDGHQLTGGDLYLMDLQTLAARALTETADRIERQPAMAGDGHTVYFEADGRIFRGWLP